MAQKKTLIVNGIIEMLELGNIHMCGFLVCGHSLYKTRDILSAIGFQPPNMSILLLLIKSDVNIISDSNWSNYKSALDVPDFHNSLEAFQDYNSSVINKEGLELATVGCQVST